MTDISICPIDFYHLLDELESGSSGSCANVIRKLREHEVAVYQAGCGGPTGGIIANFIALLDERVADKDLEIEKTCSQNYRHYVDSVKELLGVQERAESLKNTLSEIRCAIKSSCDKLNESCEALMSSDDTLEKIDNCIAALRRSLPVLDQFERVEKSISDGRYYHALKTLENLEHYHLKSIQAFSFSEGLVKRIPKLRSEIKTASLVQLTDFLEDIRKHSIRLGAIAMNRIAEKLKINEDISFDYSPFAPTKSPTKTSTTNHSKENGANLLDNDLEDLTTASDFKTSPNLEEAQKNIEDVINFTPVYHCLHIHSVAGERVEFEHYYFTQRKKQCQLILSLSPSQQASLRNYGEFFSKLVGFFLVDDYLCHTLPGASTSYQAYLTELWSMVMPKLVQLAHKNADACTTNQELLTLKQFCMLFMNTMAGLDFHTAGLGDMLDAISKRYNYLLISQWITRFNEILKKDNYTAISISSPKDMTPILADYPYCKTPEFLDLPFPRQLVFSAMVPDIYVAMREYIDACLFFVKSMDLSWTELEDSLNRATNSLFTDCLNDVLSRAIQESESNLLRLIQLTINLNELESACAHLQIYLHENSRPRLSDSRSVTDLDGSDLTIDQISYQPDDSSLLNMSRSHLYGVSLFKDARARAETQIYSNLNTRIEEFCSLASYEGIFGGSAEGKIAFDDLINCQIASTGNLKTSGYIKDLTSWLGSTFAAFTNLPPKVAQTACISASKHIVRLLQNILMGPRVRMITEPALTQFSTDLAECDIFARSDPVPGIDKSILLLIFQELRQLLDLIRKEDWNVYFTNYNKPTGNPYDRVTPAAAISLLERMREAEKRKSSFLGSMKKAERDRRKRIEDIIRQLKELQHISSGRR